MELGRNQIHFWMHANLLHDKVENAFRLHEMMPQHNQIRSIENEHITNNMLSLRHELIGKSNIAITYEDIYNCAVYRFDWNYISDLYFMKIAYAFGSLAFLLP